MNANQLSRELRRIAHREVPNGQPNLWPEIQRQLAQTRPGVPSPVGWGGRSRADAEVSSVYVWSTEGRRGRFGMGRVLAAGIVALLLVAVLAVVLSNRGGGDNAPAAVIASPLTSSATAFVTPTPETLVVWPHSGVLTSSVIPAGFVVGGTISAQILPSGDVRISYTAESARNVLVWHVISEGCKTTNQTEQQIESHDIVPPFIQPGGPPAIIPAAKTHQPMNVVAFTQQGGGPVECASIPAVPNGFVVNFAPAALVPRTCPVTLPSQPLFTPEGQSSDPMTGEGDYWYGTDDLWTGLPLDGVWNGLNQKVFWWSAVYNVNAEPAPGISVVGQRLDGNAPTAQVDLPTNGAGGMLVGMTFPTSGCWQVIGQYKGHSLSFVVWVSDSSASQFNQAPGPMPAQTPTADESTTGADGLAHTDQQCHASSFGPSTANPADINVEVGGTASAGQFWALLFQEMPIDAAQRTQIAWKIGSNDPLSLIVEDAHGNRIELASGPTRYNASNWPRPGTGWLTNIVFPYSGCWHVHAQAGDVTGDMWFEIFAAPITPPASPVPSTPVAATTTPVVTVSDCATRGAQLLLAQFVDAFNRNDQSALASMLPDTPIEGGSWVASVTSSHPPSVTGDLFATTRSDFLGYAAQRHQQGERLQITKTREAQQTWLPGYLDIVADLQRSANDLPTQPARVVAMLSCERGQIGAYSLGAAVDTANSASLTGDALIEETLRQRPLNIQVDMPGGICPADSAQRIDTGDPNLAPALGKGPLYVVMGEADVQGALHLDLTRSGGWTLFKTVWTSEPSYGGPVLVRGAQINGSNALGFGANDPPDPDLYFTATSGSLFETSYADANATGCYALQVDGLNFSEIIVIDVVP